MIFASTGHSGTPKRRIPWGVFFATASCRNAPEPVRKSKNEADDSKKQPMQLDCTGLPPLNTAKSLQLVNTYIVPIPVMVWVLVGEDLNIPPVFQVHGSLRLGLLRQHSHLLKITPGT